MRLWVDPKKLADNNLDAQDVVNALQRPKPADRRRRDRPPADRTGQPYEISVRAVGRLSTPEQFENLILRATPDGGLVRMRDVGHVDLGAEDYGTDLRYNGRPAVGVGILALPNANALDVSKGVRAEMDKLAQKFPPGVFYAGRLRLARRSSTNRFTRSSSRSRSRSRS